MYGNVMMTPLTVQFNTCQCKKDMSACVCVCVCVCVLDNSLEKYTEIQNGVCSLTDTELQTLKGQFRSYDPQRIAV
jgi:hypothetical protein